MQAKLPDFNGTPIFGSWASKPISSPNLVQPTIVRGRTIVDSLDCPLQRRASSWRRPWDVIR